MANLNTHSIALILVLVIFLCKGLEARKVLSAEDKKAHQDTTLVVSTSLHAIPSPTASPSDEKRLSVSRIENVVSTDRRHLKSVPSPGIGHHWILSNVDFITFDRSVWAFITYDISWFKLMLTNYYN